jgi:hypothetical protein
MKPEDFDMELKNIFETGKLNGYRENVMKKLYEKHKRKKELENFTSLESIDEKKLKFISMPYYPPLTNKLNNELMKFGYKVAYNNNGKLADLMKERNLEYT